MGNQSVGRCGLRGLAVAGVRTVSMKWSVAISFAFAGALGNLIDRVMYADGFLNGKVVDFLNYGWWLAMWRISIW